MYRYQATAGEVEYLIEAHEAGHVELWIAGSGPTVTGEFESVAEAKTYAQRDTQLPPSARS